MRRLLLAAPLLMAACATAAGPRVANNPCDDPQYRALKAQPVDSLSAREYEQLQEGDAACAQVTRVLAASAGTDRGPETRVDTEAYTQAMQNQQGSEIYIRNLGNVPITVTSVTLMSCVGVQDPCGTTHPRTQINPGDVRRVMRVRYREAAWNASFRYSYHVEPARPRQD
jgi:hypothetical protein